MTNSAAVDASVSRIEVPTSTAARGVRVVPRLPDIDFADTDVPRYWQGGSVGVTAVWNAIVLVGPAIESFFLRDGRRLMPHAKSPALRREFADFMRQEAYHARVHQRTYQLYEHWGIPAASLDAFVRRVLGWTERISNTKLRAAIVVAGEHFISELGHQALNNPVALADADPRMARLLLWHSYEELEHKAVCFDAFVDAYGDTVLTYVHRIIALAMAIGLLAVVLPVLTFRLLRAESAAFRWTEWRAIGRHLFGKGGVWVGRGSAIAAFLSPRFHPWKFRDDSHDLVLRKDLVPPEWAEAARRG